MQQGVFVDTWGWTALGYRREARHAEIKQYYAQMAAAAVPVCTTDYVLDETITLLFRRAPFAEASRYISGLLDAVSSGYLSLEHISPQRFAEAWKLRLKFHDKPRVSFTDLTSMVVMRELGITQVLTEDEHFQQVNFGFTRVP
jgi:predicted nucleic acid-binding protein